MSIKPPCLNFHDSGVGDGQRSLVCCSPWGLKESDTTEQLNRTELRVNSTEGIMTNSHSVFQNTYMLAELHMALLIKKKTCLRYQMVKW